MSSYPKDIPLEGITMGVHNRIPRDVETRDDLLAWLDERGMTVGEFKGTVIYRRMRRFEHDGVRLWPWLDEL